MFIHLSTKPVYIVCEDEERKNILICHPDDNLVKAHLCSFSLSLSPAPCLSTEKERSEEVV